MASVGAFTEMMNQFLTELVKTFPDESAIKKYQSTFDLMKKANPRKCVDVFMNSAIKFQNQIMNKDESFFLNENVDFLKSLNINKWWNDSLSENTKNAIWQYLQTLIILGTTITSIDADTLGAIEGIAEKMAKGSGDGVPDLSALQGLMGTLGNMKM